MSILFIAFALSFFVPKFDALEIPTLRVVILFLLFMIVFLINRAMDRKKRLIESITIELTRLRRIKHLSERLGTLVWRKKLFNAIIDYQKQLSRNFIDGKQSQKAFRIMTHLLYRFKPKDDYEKVILSDMLGVTGNLALERQHLAQYTRDRLLPTSWMVLFTGTIFLLVLILSLRTTTFVSNLSAMMGVTMVLLSMDFLYQRDRLSRYEVKEIQEQFVENIKKMKRKE